MKSSLKSKGIGLLFIFLVVGMGSVAWSQPNTVHVISVAHSHNDYLRKRPLFDALDCGFASVEADVFYRRGSFRVAHTRWGVRKKKTLQALYLNPLRHRVKVYNGSVYADWEGEFVLMLDLKGDWDTTALRQLENHLLEYPELFLTTHQGSGKRVVRAVLSGAYSATWIEDFRSDVFSFDGRLSTLNWAVGPDKMPRASTSFRSHFSWKCRGTMPAEERAQLHRMVSRAVENQRKFRFWGAPDCEALWMELLRTEIGWIGVDDLQKFNRFYMKNRGVE